MMQVNFDESAADDVERFILFYKSLFLKLYEDSGLGEAEEIIKNTYIVTSRKMQHEIFDLIVSSLQSDNILGYEDRPPLRRIAISYKRYRIFIDYKENLLTRERTVMHITLTRK